MTWNADSALIVSDPAESSGLFGIGLAISRDGLVMASAQYGWDPSGGTGGVFIFDRVGAAWEQRGGVLLPGDAAGDFNFGYGLALNEDGTILVVGSPGHQSDFFAYGAVYIYDWSGSAWVQRGSILRASDKEDTDKFGQSVALNASGDVLAVGAYQWEGATSNQGGVYIYDWSGSAWTERSSIVVSDSPASGVLFGVSVALSADGLILAVGESLRTGTLTAQGGVYVYDWSGSAWSQRAIFYDPTAAASDHFGRSVALAGAGDYILIGAPEKNTPTDSGRAYLFSWADGAWTLIATFIAADAGSDDRFGTGVALSEDVVTAVISAYNWDGSDGSDQGAVYTYTNDDPPVIDPPPGPAPEPIPAPHVYTYSAYITGAPDSLPDYAFNLTSFGLSKRSAAVSYYAITAQFTDSLIDALNARPAGIMHILRDGEAWESFNIAHPIRFDRGPRSASISISGTRQETIADPETIAIEPRMAADEGINSDGMLTIDLVPGYVDPRPGDSITWDGITYLIELIKYQANEGGQTLSINASEPA